MMWQGDSVRWETEEADTRGWDVGTVGLVLVGKRALTWLVDFT